MSTSHQVQKMEEKLSCLLVQLFFYLNFLCFQKSVRWLPGSDEIAHSRDCSFFTFHTFLWLSHLEKAPVSSSSTTAWSWKISRRCKGRTNASESNNKEVDEEEELHVSCPEKHTSFEGNSNLFKCVKCSWKKQPDHVTSWIRRTTKPKSWCFSLTHSNSTVLPSVMRLWSTSRASWSGISDKWRRINLSEAKTSYTISLLFSLHRCTQKTTAPTFGIYLFVCSFVYPTQICSHILDMLKNVSTLTQMKHAHIYANCSIYASVAALAGVSWARCRPQVPHKLWYVL